MGWATSWAIFGGRWAILSLKNLVALLTILVISSSSTLVKQMH
jgi:hypothetical protein